MRRAVWLAISLAWVSTTTALAQGNSNPHGKLPDGMECTACHSAEQWKPLRQGMTFDHGKATGFAITGKHAAVACSSCHGGLRFSQRKAKPRDCVSCHTDVHQSRLGRDCAACHDTRSFTGKSSIQAHVGTTFPLKGAHAQVPCEGCHRDERAGRYTALDTRCVSCHRPDYERGHSSGGVSTTCTTCHTSDQTWRSAAFRHDVFPLVGAHSSLACAQCHAPGDNHLLFAKPAGSSDCVACHRADYDRKHVGTNFPTTCLSCHTAQTWSGASFRHDIFPLAGAHAALACASCHAPGDNHLLFNKPTGTSDCVACHRADYDRQHTGSGYPTTCLTCHTTNTTWTGASVDHLAISKGFALLGAHIRATCSSCHAPPDGKLVFSPPPASTDDCVACHRRDYDSHHGTSGYPTLCISCHNNDRWTGATFTHDKFPLVGAHLPLPCTACHAPPNNALIFPIPTGAADCVACHRADYDREHTGSGFPTTCTSCHTTSTWTGAVFDHAAVGNGFVLQGIHAQKPCSVCHAPDGTPLFRPAGAGDCYTCHAPDYTTAHGTIGFPTTCTLCHQPTDWTQTTFDHDRQYFPIYSGAHQGRWSRCQDCHTSQTDFKVFTCLTCHTKTKTDADHSKVSNYTYDSVRCYACHPRGNH